MTSENTVSLVVKEFEKVSHSAEASLAAAKFTLSLSERNLNRYAWSWGNPCITVFRDNVCVGILIYKSDDDDLAIDIESAWADKDHPQVLSMMLMRLRSKFKKSRYDRVRFSFAKDNQDMVKVMKALNVQPRSYNLEMKLK